MTFIYVSNQDCGCSHSIQIICRSNQTQQNQLYLYGYTFKYRPIIYFIKINFNISFIIHEDSSMDGFCTQNSRLGTS